MACSNIIQVQLFITYYLSKKKVQLFIIIIIIIFVAEYQGSWE
jgi:hypothetical protein